MGKVFKIVSSSIAVLFLLFVLMIVVLTTVINPNDYRNQIEQFLYSKTGRIVDIQGEIQWSLFPRLGVNLPEVTIGNPKGITGPKFAHIEKLNLQARLFSLLFGKIEIDEINLDNAKINFIVEKDNTNNWQQWRAANQPRLTFYASMAPTALIKTKSNKALPIRSVSISNLTMRNSRIQFIDRKNDKTYQFRNVDMNITGFKNDRDFPVQVAFDVKIPDSDLAVQQRLNATAHLNLKQNLFTLPEFTITSFLIRPELGKLPIDLEGKLEANLKQKNLNVSDLTLQIANLSLKGGLTVTTQNGQSILKAELGSSGTALKPLLTALTGKSVFSGKMNWKTTLTGDLSSAHFSKTLSGQGQLDITDGSLEGVNLAHLLKQAIAYAGSGSKTPLLENVPNETAFTAIRATYTIGEGILKNNDLVMEFAPFVGKGSGSIDLNANTLNYQLNLQSTESANKNIVLPVMITGNLAHPNIHPNFENIAGQFFKKELKNFLNDRNNGKNLKDSLRNLLP